MLLDERLHVFPCDRQLFLQTCCLNDLRLLLIRSFPAGSLSFLPTGESLMAINFRDRLEQNQKSTVQSQ